MQLWWNVLLKVLRTTILERSISWKRWREMMESLKLDTWIYTAEYPSYIFSMQFWCIEIEPSWTTISHEIYLGYTTENAAKLYCFWTFVVLWAQVWNWKPWVNNTDYLIFLVCFTQLFYILHTRSTSYSLWQCQERYLIGSGPVQCNYMSTRRSAISESFCRQNHLLWIPIWIKNRPAAQILYGCRTKFHESCMNLI